MIDISNGKNHFINVQKIDRIIKSVCNNNDEIYNYGNVKGNEGLRKQLAEFYNARYNAQITSHNVMITNGSQQSLAILLDYIRLNNYSTINITTPTYYGIIELANIKQIHLNNHSTIDTINTNNQIIYLTPYFNNPNGKTLTKKEITQICSLSNNNIIIEDDPYSLLSFDNKINFPLFTMCKNVIYLGTFSKIISPSTNIGYIICKDEKIINMLYAVKKANSLHTSAFIQKVVSEYLKEDLIKEIQTKTLILKNNYLSIKRSIKKYFGKDVVIGNIDGGYFAVATFSKNIDNLKNCVDFCFNTLQDFYTNKNLGKNQLRINLSQSINYDNIFKKLSNVFYQNT